MAENNQQNIINNADANLNAQQQNDNVNPIAPGNGVNQVNENVAQPGSNITETNTTGANPTAENLNAAIEDRRLENIPENSNLTYSTTNDKEWADKNCVYMFHKYIDSLEDGKEYDMDKFIWSIMKDLHVFFDVQQNDEIQNNAYNRLQGNTVRSKAFFKEELYKYIAEYRDYKIKELQKEGIVTLTNAFSMKSKELEEYFESKKKENPQYFFVQNIVQIIDDFKELTSLRLI